MAEQQWTTNGMSTDGDESQCSGQKVKGMVSIKSMVTINYMDCVNNRVLISNFRVKLAPNVYNGNGAGACETTPDYGSFDGQNDGLFVGTGPIGYGETAKQPRNILIVQKGIKYNGRDTESFYNVPRYTCIIVMVPNTSNLLTVLVKSLPETVNTETDNVGTVTNVQGKVVIFLVCTPFLDHNIVIPEQTTRETACIDVNNVPFL